jgi:hypothetical protein
MWKPEVQIPIQKNIQRQNRTKKQEKKRNIDKGKKKLFFVGTGVCTQLHVW